MNKYHLESKLVIFCGSMYARGIHVEKVECLPRNSLNLIL